MQKLALCRFRFCEKPISGKKPEYHYDAISDKCGYGNADNPILFNKDEIQ